MQPDVLVIGAGVSGLTTAVSLAEDGLNVLIRTSEPPGRTASVAAGAIWGPFMVGHQDTVRWSYETLAVFEKLARTEAAGIELVRGIEAARDPIEMPNWVRRLPDSRECLPAELPAGFATGWWYTAPVVDMPVYLSYLEARFRDAGGRIEMGHVASLADAVAEVSIVVNCTGAGSRELVPDVSLTPVRGQLLVLDNPGLTEFFAEYGEDEDLTYFLPQGDQVILGGCAQDPERGIEPDPVTAAAILARCAEIEPRLRHSRVRGHRVGMRPCRPQVRVEPTTIHNGYIVHNYGHGGSGVSLSWACAAEVLNLVRTWRER